MILVDINFFFKSLLILIGWINLNINTAVLQIDEILY